MLKPKGEKHEEAKSGLKIPMIIAAFANASGQVVPTSAEGKNQPLYTDIPIEEWMNETEKENISENKTVENQKPQENNDSGRGVVLERYIQHWKSSKKESWNHFRQNISQRQFLTPKGLVSTHQDLAPYLRSDVYKFDDPLPCEQSHKPYLSYVSIEDRARPPMYLLISRQPSLFSPGQPLYKDPLIDYDADTDEEWEEFAGDDVDQENEEEEEMMLEGEGEENEDFVIPDGEFETGEIGEEETALLKNLTNPSNVRTMLKPIVLGPEKMHQLFSQKFHQIFFPPQEASLNVLQHYADREGEDKRGEEKGEREKRGEEREEREREEILFGSSVVMINSMSEIETAHQGKRSRKEMSQSEFLMHDEKKEQKIKILQERQKKAEEEKRRKIERQKEIDEERKRRLEETEKKKEEIERKKLEKEQERQKIEAEKKKKLLELERIKEQTNLTKQKIAEEKLLSRSNRMQDEIPLSMLLAGKTRSRRSSVKQESREQDANDL